MNHKRISILEDDPAIMDIYQLLLGAEGYQVDGHSTVSSFFENSSVPDLYLLDLQLPDGSGTEVCVQLKADPRYAKVPVLMLSAHADLSSMRMECLADDFMEKPFDLDRLLERVSHLLSLKQ